MVSINHIRRRNNVIFILYIFLKMINETFNIKNASRIAKDGHEYKIAYIDPQTSEETYNFRDEIKKFKANFFPDIRAWGWYLGDNPEDIYRRYIQPCLKYLASVENSGSGERGENDVIRAIDELIAEIGKGNVEQMNIPSAKNLTEELQNFKAELMNYVGSDKFKQMIEPIIKFQQAQGHQFSFKNAILIMFQDPKATLVKSKTGWLKMNRMVVDNSHPILLWRPDSNIILTKEEKNMIVAAYLNELGVDSVDALNPGEKEELNIRLRGNKDAQSFKTYFGYDIRFTKQIEGKEELVGDRTQSLDWFDKSTDKSEYLSLLIDSTIKMIEDSGVKIKYVPSEELGSALGMATGSGEIILSKDAEPVLNYFNTIAHEFAHQLLHIKYLKKASEVSGNNEWAQFYVGSPKGRKVVEQQAELCAWLVLKHFNYDVTSTSAIYAASWGMTSPKIAAQVFDSISGVASFMISKIGRYMSAHNR